MKHVDTSSSSTWPHPPSDAIISKDAASSIGNVSNDPSLGRSILEAYGKEIFEFASDRFLDLAILLRLKTINAGDLVNLLAKAERLRYSKTDVIRDEDVKISVSDWLTFPYNNNYLQGEGAFIICSRPDP